MKAGVVITICICLLGAARVWADLGNCAVCGKPLEGKIFLWQDKVDHQKKLVCEKCCVLPVCYLCGMPTGRDRTRLPDGRVLCSRDAKTVVLDEAEALDICREMKDLLDRQFSRFISIPDANVTVSVVDRVSLMTLLGMPGNDYACPNVLGYTKQLTNGPQTTYRISLMSGLSDPMLRATCVHEYTHVWVNENVSRGRRKRLDQDAVEGFCELVSYLLVEANGEKSMLDTIKSNAYTRGQIDLFVEAEHRYGFNDIVDWMKYGQDRRLRADDLSRVRDIEPDQVEPAGPRAPASLPVQTTRPSRPTSIRLNGVFWSKTRPTALINNTSFRPGQEASVPLGSTNVTVRCVEIREDAAVIEIVATGQRQELSLDKDSAR